MDNNKRDLAVKVHAGIVKMMEVSSTTSVSGGTAYKGYSTGVSSRTTHRRSVDVDLDGGGYATLSFKADELPLDAGDRVNVLFSDPKSPQASKKIRRRKPEVLGIVDSKGRYVLCNATKLYSKIYRPILTILLLHIIIIFGAEWVSSDAYDSYFESLGRYGLYVLPPIIVFAWLLNARNKNQVKTKFNDFIADI